MALQKSMFTQMELESEQLAQQNACSRSATEDAEQSVRSLRADLGNRRTEVAAQSKELVELRARLGKFEAESAGSKKALALAAAGARRDADAANAVKQRLAAAEAKVAAAEAAAPPSPPPSTDERIASTTAEIEERYQNEMRTFEQSKHQSVPSPA